MSYKSDLKDVIMQLQAGSQLYDLSSGIVEAAIIGNGIPVLISHGGSGGYDMGVWLAGLIGQGYQYIAPSRFGYLRTPIPADPTPENQADEYLSLIDYLNLESVFMLGLSSGGPSALQFALRHPDRCRGLIMLSAISRQIPPLPFVLRLIFPLMLRSDFVPWLIYSISPNFIYRSNGVNRSLLAEIKNDSEKMDLLSSLYNTSFPTSLRRDGIINDMQQVAVLPDYDLEAIELSTIVIHAVDDPIVPFALGEFTSQRISGAKFLRIKDGGHFCTVTHREVIIPRIRNLLGSVGSQ
jgi:pimeloyl-ACP methyl ester carboxylesterase